jgi:hypothetical protein
MAMSDLSDLRAPDEAGARARAWTALAAEPLPARPASRRAPLALAAALAAAVVLALALTPPGDAVATWVKRAVGVEAPAPRPTGLERLPGGGRVLLVTPSVWIAGGGQAPRQLLGAVDEATWSPHGRFVAAIRARAELIAVDMKGHRRWHVAPRGGDLRGARWSPDGFRVAYLSGRTLRVVAGDGTNDLLFARAWPAPAPTWRPGRAHVIAYLDRHRRLAVGDTDTAALLFRRRAPGRVRQLLWTPGGRQLIVVGARQVKVLDGRTGRALRAYAAPRGWTTEAAVLTGRGLAFVRLRGSRAEVVDAAGRALFAAPGIGAIASAPNGRWLLVDWHQTDAWVFLPVGTSRRPPRQVSHIARHFAHGEPVLAGWCCAPR